MKNVLIIIFMLTESSISAAIYSIKVANGDTI